MDQTKGDLYKYAVAQMDEDDIARRRYRPGATGKSLGHFANEDGEPDVYEQYIAESTSTKQKPIDSLKKQVKREADFQRVANEARQNVLTEPSFEEFFDREAEGKYVFDNVSGAERERSQVEDEFERILEDQESEQLHRRELLARLYGGKLTTRQLGVLIGTTTDDA